MRPESEPTSRRTARAAGILLLGWTLSAALYFALDHQRSVRDEKELRVRVAAAESSIRDRLTLYVEALRAGANYVGSSQALKRSEWERYGRSLEIERRYPAMIGVGLVEAVSASRTDGYVERARGDGAPGFRIHDVPGAPARDRRPGGAVRYVVRYLEPRKPNAAEIGLDLASDPVRRRAAERARDTGEPTMTGPVARLTDAQSGPGFLVFVPWYGDGAPTGDERERRRALRGWVYAPLVARELFAGVPGGISDELALEVWPGDAPGDGPPVFSSAAGAGDRTSLTSLTLLGQPFALRWRPRGALLHHDVTPALLGGAAALLALLLAGLALRRPRTTTAGDQGGEVPAQEPADAARPEAALPAPEQAPFDLRETIEDVAELLVARSSERHLELFVRFVPGTPRQVLGDMAHVRQVLINLAGNALTFTPQGHVLIEAAPSPDADGRSRVRLTVRDTGVGIAPEMLARLFTRSQSADALTTRLYGGTGMGLRVVRELTTLMGGEVGAESEPGVGSAFHVTLPLLAAPEAEPPAPAADGRVLVVESADLLRRIFAEDLQARGWDVETATGADEAVGTAARAAAAGRRFDLMLVGIGRDGRTAEGLARAVRIVSGERRPAVLAVTSYGRRGEAQRFKTLGFDGMLVRPVRAAELHEAATVLLGASRSGEWPLFVTRYTLPSCAANGAPARREGEANAQPVRRVLLAEDNAVNQKMASRLLEALGCRVDLAANGVEAVALAREHTYDLVFMDCQMPEKDGYEAAREIRLLPGGDELPIVALTASTLAQDRTRCFEAGMNDHVAKPVTREAIESAIVRWERAA